MNTMEMTLSIAAGSMLAGFLGSLTGLGGGVVIVPLLSLIFGVEIRYAIGASLVSVIATSSGSAAAYVKGGYTNIRIGMLLEVATVLGALCGALIAGWVSTAAIAIIFGVVLLFSAYASLQIRPNPQVAFPQNALSQRLKLDGSYPAMDGTWRSYHVQSIPAGFSLMGLAGVLSGLLGIGSGALKVIAMDQFMKIPFKVSTTTSNFMIGVTAAASAGIYLRRGYIDPGLAMPVMLGVLVGSMLGAKVLVHVRTQVLRYLFAVVILILGLEMIVNGFMGRL